MYDNDFQGIGDVGGLPPDVLVTEFCVAWAVQRVTMLTPYTSLIYPGVEEGGGTPEHLHGYEANHMQSCTLTFTLFWTQCECGTLLSLS